MPREQSAAKSKLFVRHIGLYDEVITDDRGRPVSVKALTSTLKGKVFEKTLYLRIGGDPGAYWLKIEANVSEPHRLAAAFSPFHVVVPRDGDAHLIVDIPIENTLPGNYTIGVSLANIELARLDFQIG